MAIDVVYWGPKMEEISILKNSVKKIKSFRKYNEIRFTNNEDDDRLRFKYAQLEIKNMVSTNDTLTGFHFSLHKQTRYWQLVKIIDICTLEKVDFRFGENDIWVFYKMPVTTNELKNSFFCNIGRIDSEYIKQHKDSISWHLAFMKACSSYIIITITALVFALLKMKF